jgi:hypothetical protein
MGCNLDLPVKTLDESTLSACQGSELQQDCQMVSGKDEATPLWGIKRDELVLGYLDSPSFVYRVATGELFVTFHHWKESCCLPFIRLFCSLY